MYSTRIREALKNSIDTGKLAEAWAALNPGAVKAGDAPPFLALFLQRAMQAILDALRRILPQAWTEGWVLGQQAAQAITAGATAADWQGWTPGDYAAANAIAGPLLQQLLDSSGIVIQSIAQTRLDDLAAVLEETLRSDVTALPQVGQPIADQPYPPRLSVSALAIRLREVLDNPRNAELVAQAEIARAQSAATVAQYRDAGVQNVEWSSAEDDRVCPLCEANVAAGEIPAGTPFPSGAVMPPQHPRCRCALLVGASELGVAA